MNPRMPRLQIPELTRLAKDAPCLLMIPGVHRYDGEKTVVWAHSNLLEHGHGMGAKSHDPFGAFACYWCHHAIDHGSALSHEEKVHYMRKGMDRTLLYLWQHDLIGVRK
jgi:hypothetical protein